MVPIREKIQLIGNHMLAWLDRLRPRVISTQRVSTAKTALLVLIGAMVVVPVTASAAIPALVWTVVQWVAGAGVAYLVGPSVIASAMGDVLTIVLLPLSMGWQWLTAVIMTKASDFLDATIALALGDTLNAVTGIQVGWQVLRDFANLFFIFVILYIAIETILQLGGHNTKQMLVRVIVVALLINFSAFFTRVVIDAGNIIAVGFYNQIIASPPPRAPDPTNPNCATSPCSIGQRFASALEIHKFPNTDGASIAGPVAATQGTELARATIYFFNGIFFLIVAFIFLKGAFYMLARTAAFMFLIMFSPIAFLSYAFPNGSVKQFGEKWWSKLTSYTLLAPFYMMILYLVLLIIGAPGFLTQSTGVNLLNFALVIVLLWFGSNYAFDMADSAGKSMVKWGSAAVLGGGIWAGARVGSFVGRQVGKRMVNDDVKARAEAGDKMALRRLNLATRMQEGSWDIRKAKIGKYETGKFVTKQLESEGLHASFMETHTPGEHEKEEIDGWIKQAKDLYPENSALQASYVRSKMGEEKYKESKHKDVKELRTKAQNDTFKKIESENIERHMKSLEKSGVWTKSKDDELREAIEKNDKVAITRLRGELDTALKTATTDAAGAATTIGADIKKSMQKLGPRFVSELSEKTLGSNLLGAHLTSNDLQQIHRNDLEGKYGDKTFINKVAKNVFGGGLNQRGEDYLASPEGRKSLFNYGVSRRQVAGTKVYAKNARLRKKLKREIADIELDIATYPPGRTPAEQQAAKDAIIKLEDRLEKKRAEFEKKEEDTRTMLS